MPGIPADFLLCYEKLAAEKLSTSKCRRERAAQVLALVLHRALASLLFSNIPLEVPSGLKMQLIVVNR